MYEQSKLIFVPYKLLVKFNRLTYTYAPIAEQEKLTFY